MHVNQIKLCYFISYSIPITVKSTFRPFSALWQYSRNSRPEVFCKKAVLRNFTKFTGKYLCQSLFFNKVAGLRPATLLKKRLCHRCFPESFVKFRSTPFFIEHVWWLLLVPSVPFNGHSAENWYLVLQKSFVIDILQGSKHTFDCNTINRI